MLKFGNLLYDYVPVDGIYMHILVNVWVFSCVPDEARLAHSSPPSLI